MGRNVVNAKLDNGIETNIMKKKIQIILISLSMIFFLTLFVKDVITTFNMFSDPNGFTLMPLLWAVIYLVIMLCHVGLYVILMDKKTMNVVVTDENEWWTRWDRV